MIILSEWPLLGCMLLCTQQSFLACMGWLFFSQSKNRPLRALPTQLVTHPLFGVVLFLIFFPGWALVSSLQQHCAAGELAICRHNNPDPVLARELKKEPFVPNWRPDGRCGSNFPAPSGHLSSVCNPFAKQHCCSQWGWCGKGPEFCAQAVKPPYNTTGTGGVILLQLACKCCTCYASDAF